MRVIGISVLVACLVALLPQALSAKVTQESVFYYTIEGEPPNERLVLDEARSFESNCEQEPHPGCVNVPKYYLGQIEFVVPGSDWNCSDGDDLWRLDKVRIGGVTRLRSPGPVPDEWGGLNDLDSRRAAADFGANKETGEVRFQKRKRRPSAFWILNNNWYLVSTWYQVTAVHCSDPGRTASAEGRIDNRGQ